MKVSPAGLKPGVHTAGQMASGVAGSWPGPPWSWPRAPSLPTHKDGRDDARPQQSAGSTSRRKPTLRFEASFWGCRSRGRRGRSAQGLLMDSAWTGHLDFHPYLYSVMKTPVLQMLTKQVLRCSFRISDLTHVKVCASARA